MLGRKGKVWADRYHRHDLKTPREAFVGYTYLFHNYAHHGEWSYGEGVLDFYSSAWRFDGWANPHMKLQDSERWLWPVCPAQTWLATRGFLKHGRVPIVPRPRP